MLLIETLEKRSKPRKVMWKWYQYPSVQPRGVKEDIHLSLFRP